MALYRLGLDYLKHGHCEPSEAWRGNLIDTRDVKCDTTFVLNLRQGIHVKSNDALKLVASLLLSFSAAALGSLATTAQSEWYVKLAMPSFTPPGWVFGPVWTVLYTFMGVAFFLVWRRGFSGKAGLAALVCFLVQLALNAAWTLLFFRLQSPAFAFADILLLLAAIQLTILSFSWVSKVAACLLIPYLAWVTFAAVLSGAIWRLNP